jgi:polar amino acid transport system ATP-binding protein
MIKIDNITKSFGSTVVLNEVSLDVRSGEVLAIIGRSGSGKSTLLRCLNGLERIDGGTITFEGKPLSYERSALRSLRRDVAMVFQSYNLFPHMTVEDNVSFAPRIVGGMRDEPARKLAAEMLDRVGLSDKLQSHPRDLSGGQQQRVAIARALAVKPKLLLLDEVTAALDPELVGEVLRVLSDLANDGLTMILVTHEIGFAKMAADRVLFMHSGKVHEIGPAAEVLEQPRTPELQKFLSAVLH